MVHPDCPARAEATAGSATFAFCFGNLHNLPAIFLHKRKCAVGTEADAHTAACTSFFNAHGKVRFKFDFTLMDGDTCRRRCAFGRCNSIRNILGSLTDACKENTCSCRSAWIEFRVGFKEPAIHGTGYTEELAGPVGICFWLYRSCEYHKVDFHGYRAVQQGIIGIDIQVLCFRILEDVCNPSADELGALVLDTVIELFIHLTE